MAIVNEYNHIHQSQNWNVYIINDKFYPGQDASQLISISDKIACLYRENEKEQIESWVNAKKTNNFFTSWKFRNINDSYEYQYFLDLKKGFKNNFINDTNFIITYEELYYGDKIDKIIEYLGIENINKSTWPLGKKYRVDLEIKSII